MARDYNYYYYAGADNKRPAFGGGNGMKSKHSLNSSMNKKQNNGNEISDFNLKKVVSMGLVFNTFQKGNELLGAITENRLRQRRIDVASTFAKYGIGLAINPLAGAIYAGSDLGYRSIMYGIKVQKQNRESDYYRRLSGNNAYSNSRYRGEFR